MAVLSATDVGKLALANGFPRDRGKLTLAIAIAKAESGFDTNAKSNTNDHGLWQINATAHRIADVNTLYDPNINAQQMVRISQGGTNWKPWVVFQRKTHAMFIFEANTAALAALESDSGFKLPGVETAIGVVEGANDAAKGLGAIGDALGMLTDPERQKRTLKVIAGLGLGITGFVILKRDTIGAVASLIPVGRAAKVANAVT